MLVWKTEAVANHLRPSQRIRKRQSAEAQQRNQIAHGNRYAQAAE
jgi:hypothetical protein